MLLLILNQRRMFFDAFGGVFVASRMPMYTGVDRWGTGGTRPPTFQLGGDHIGNVPPPTFLLKKWKTSCVLSPSNLHSLSACVIDTGVYK